jgi:hypothetical protein
MKKKKMMIMRKRKDSAEFRDYLKVSVVVPLNLRVP